MDILVLETGDATRLMWDLMALAEKAEQEKDLALLKERFYLAQRAGFKLREQDQRA